MKDWISPKARALSALLRFILATVARLAGASMCSLLCLATTASAQSFEISKYLDPAKLLGIMPSERYPQKVADCEALSEEYEALISEVQAARTACIRSTPHDPRAFSGTCCQEWARAAPGFWCNVQATCASLWERSHCLYLSRQKEMKACFSSLLEQQRTIPVNALETVDAQIKHHTTAYDLTMKGIHQIWAHSRIGNPLADKMFSSSMKQVEAQHKLLLDELLRLRHDIQGQRPASTGSISTKRGSTPKPSNATSVNTPTVHTSSTPRSRTKGSPPPIAPTTSTREPTTTDQSINGDKPISGSSSVRSQPDLSTGHRDQSPPSSGASPGATLDGGRDAHVSVTSGSRSIPCTATGHASEASLIKNGNAVSFSVSVTAVNCAGSCRGHAEGTVEYLNKYGKTRKESFIEAWSTRRTDLRIEKHIPAGCPPCQLQAVSIKRVSCHD